MTFDKMLHHLMALIGRSIEVQVFNGSEQYLLAHFTGQLLDGFHVGDEASLANDEEAVYLRLRAGDESAAFVLDRNHFRGAEWTRDPPCLIIRTGSVALHVLLADAA